MNNKLLKWNVSAVKSHCREYECSSCQFLARGRKCVFGEPPRNWQLESVPTWSDSDIAIAKAFFEHCGNVTVVRTDENVVKFIDYYNSVIAELNGIVLFLSLAVGESVRLQDIIADE